jgi:hypothetical protein
MRQHTKVQLETIAKKRSEQIGRSSPDLVTRTAFDDSGLRCAVQVMRDEELVRLEFIESDITAGQQKFFDDYLEVASNTGTLVLLFPESKYPREMASAIYQGVMAYVRSKSRCEVAFQGFVYDDRGTIKKVD